MAWVLSLLQWERKFIPGSSSGRTAASEAVNRGSNPCPGTITTRSYRPEQVVSKKTRIPYGMYASTKGGIDDACIMKIKRV